MSRLWIENVITSEQYWVNVDDNNKYLTYHELIEKAMDLGEIPAFLGVLYQIFNAYGDFIGNKKFDESMIHIYIGPESPLAP